MRLFHETQLRLSWLVSLARTIWQLTARRMVATVTIVIVGQLSMVMAMLLPLKAMLLAATDGVPWYLSGLVSAETKDHFIVILVVGALLAYGVSLLGERIIAGQLRAGAATILKKSRKLSQFPNERQLVRTHYMRFCRITASAALFVLMLVLGLVVDPPLFLIVLALAVTEYCVIDRVLRHDSAAAEAILKAFREARSNTLAILANLTFLIGFVILFAQFLGSNERNAIVAIVTFLLLRQTTNRLRLAIQDFIALSDDRHRVNALFHTHIHYAPPDKLEQENFLRAMTPAERQRWLPRVLAEIAGISPESIVDSYWNDTSSLAIAALDVRVRQAGAPETPGRKRPPFDFFLRCFSASQAHLAEHETRLFESPSPPPFAPRYIGRATVGDVIVLLFAGLPPAKPSKKHFVGALGQLQRACEATPLDATLRDEYERTHPSLPKRLKPSVIERLSTAATHASDETTVGTLLQALPDIRLRLAGLPTVLDNPDLSQQFCRVNGDGDLIAWAWHRWRIDVPAAHASPDGDDSSSLPDAHELPDEALRGEEGLRALSARLTALERDLQRGLFARALQHAGQVNSMWLRIQGLAEPAVGADDRELLA